jgi:sialidase-1
MRVSQRPLPLAMLLAGSLLSLVSVLAYADEGRMVNDKLWLAAGVEVMPNIGMGPFVRVKDGRILTVDTGQNALASDDEGKTWKTQPIFEDAAKFAISPERALLCTREGTVILAFSNYRETTPWQWDAKTSDSPPDTRLPTYAVRSVDGGKTWQDCQKLHDAWTGAIRDMVQTPKGTVVFTSMMMLHNPGRHSVVTYASKDEGKTWTRGNILDLGGVGHHGGVTEATLETLADGRIWMLLRTNWKVFWSAFSDDDGFSWRTIGPSTIGASSAPGLLKRLADGRLVLIWNRYFPEGKDSFPLSGGDNQWSEVPVSNHRLELSIMFSDDDGKNWSKPVVIARDKKDWLAYPYAFEVAQGELWITTMQGDVRVKLREKDFVR